MVRLVGIACFIVFFVITGIVIWNHPNIVWNRLRKKAEDADGTIMIVSAVHEDRGSMDLFDPQGKVHTLYDCAYVDQVPVVGRHYKLVYNPNASAYTKEWIVHKNFVFTFMWIDDV
jgi:hypothetical protein